MLTNLDTIIPYVAICFGGLVGLCIVLLLAALGIHWIRRKWHQMVHGQ